MIVFIHAACVIINATFLKTPSPDQPKMLNVQSVILTVRITKLLQPYHTTKKNLVGRGLGELEGDVAAGETAVDLSVGVDTVVNTLTLLLIKDDLEGLGAVLLGADALADDLDGVAEIGEDSVVDSSKSAGAGALLGLGVAGAGRALGAGEDAARSEDQDLAVRELLLELTGQTGVVVSNRSLNHKGVSWLFLPLLNTVEALQGRDGDKDDNSLLAVADFDLFVDHKSACELQDNKPWTASRPVSIEVN